MNALEIHNAISSYAAEHSISFKETLSELKEIQKSLKLLKVRSGLVKSITLETLNDWPSVVLTLPEFLSIIKGGNKELEKEKSLHTDAEIKELTIKFVDGSSRKYDERSTSSSGNPSQEISCNINYLTQCKFDTTW